MNSMAALSRLNVAAALQFARPRSSQRAVSGLAALRCGVGASVATAFCSIQSRSFAGSAVINLKSTAPAFKSRPVPPADRALATVRRITAIKPIENADRILLAMIGGWQVVIAKSDGFAVGDRVVYLEIDSFLPVEPRFEFLRATSHATHPTLGEGFRLKTAKMRGQISQGLVLPMEVLPHPADDYAIGEDVTAALGVRKWEDVSLGLGNGTPFPTFLKKTDQPRIQNIFGELYGPPTTEGAIAEDETFEVSLKLDGTSCTVFHNDGQLGVCSRNQQVWKPDDDAASASVYSRVGAPIAARLAEAVRDVKSGAPRNLALQGEIMGPGIQGNREQLKEPKLFVFDIWDIDAQQYLPSDERRALCAKLGVDHVPILHASLPVRKTHPTLESLLAYVDKLPSMKHSIAEGAVFKSNARPNLSFKAISNRFLLKCEV